MGNFVDYYELLQISPNAELRTIQRVYRLLVGRYHPDNPQTGDMEMFLLLQHAYDVLSDPEKRAAYNREHQDQRVQPLPIFDTKDFVVGVEAEGNRRLGMLCLLYNRRRSDPDHPSLSVFDLETIMSFPREHLEFTSWYLRERGYLRRDDNGELLITAQGVDYVESNISDNRIVNRLLGPPTNHRPSS